MGRRTGKIRNTMTRPSFNTHKTLKPRKAVIAAAGFSVLLLSMAPAEAFFYRRGPLNPLPPHAIDEIVRLDYGFRTIRSLDRQGLYYVVEGLDRRGFGARVVLHAYHGYLIDSMALRPPAQVPHHLPQRLARAEPGYGHERGDTRIVPVPPARPIIRQAVPETRPPAAKPPVAATAPATTVPRAVSRPSLIPDTGTSPSGTAPAAARDTPASRAAPRLVNPQDVRPSDEAERSPPMARGSSAGPALPKAAPRVIAPGVFSPGAVPPAALDDTTTRPRGPETAPVPVTPLN